MSRKAAAEKAKLEAALKAASEDARRLFISHEKDRRVMEQTDKAASDAELFDRVRERERLRHEHAEYVEIVNDLRDIRQVYLDEAKRHDAWNRVKDFSWLPDVDSEAQITAFLASWKESQEHAMGMMNTDEVVHFKYTFGNTSSFLMRNVQMDSMVLQRIDTAPAANFRKERLDEDLRYCVLAVRLTEDIWKAADVAWLNGQHQAFEKHRAHIKLVNEQIQSALDRLTCVIGQNLDVFIDPEEETVLRLAPPGKEASPYIKYGIWVRNSEKRVNVNQIKYADLGIYIDPRDSQNVRLPRALGLQQATNIAMRAMQLTFDPCSVLCSESVCQNYIALDCILVLESITFPERVKKLSDWQCRVESANSFELHRNEYPPKQERGFSSQSDDITMKISFELPKTVSMRQHSLMIGKWNAQKLCWEHCSTASMLQESIRRFAFLTADLTVLAVIQEKGFDVPYERWHLRPVSDDEVIFSIEGRHRGENSDREVVIAIRENLCRLVGPEDAELAHLRSQWLPPPTLLRLLARAGYNFILNDVDGQNLPHILTKSKALETKAYADIALFASTYAFSSSHHNKAGEDRDMALFRISKERLTDAMETGLDPDPEDENKWWSVRYETERCTLAQFSERDHDAQLSCLPGRVTHLNLFKILAAEHGEEIITRTVKDSNPLLQQGVLAVLSIVRPFTWG